MRAWLRSSGPYVVQLGSAVMLVVASLLTDLLVVRLLDVVLALTIASFAAFMLGRRSAWASLERSFAWMPTNVSIATNEDGTRVAIVEQRSGAIVTLELPDEIDSTDAAMHFILDELSE